MMEFYVFIAIKGAHKKRRRLEKVLSIIESHGNNGLTGKRPSGRYQDRRVPS